MIQQSAKMRIIARMLSKRFKKRSAVVKKHCRFTARPELAKTIDYKNVELLKQFLTQRGKILPARISGTSACYQRLITKQIKLARSMGLVPYCLIRGI